MTCSFLYLGLSGLVGLNLVFSGLSNPNIAMAKVEQPTPAENLVLASRGANLSANGG